MSQVHTKHIISTRQNIQIIILVTNKDSTEYHYLGASFEGFIKSQKYAIVKSKVRRIKFVEVNKYSEF